MSSLTAVIVDRGVCNRNLRTACRISDSNVKLLQVCMKYEMLLAFCGRLILFGPENPDSSGVY